MKVKCVTLAFLWLHIQDPADPCRVFGLSTFVDLQHAR